MVLGLEHQCFETEQLRKPPAERAFNGPPAATITGKVLRNKNIRLVVCWPCFGALAVHNDQKQAEKGLW